MPQARRIKKKAPSKTKKRARLDLPWGLIVVVFVCGFVLAKLISGAQSDSSSFGSGLKALLQSSQQAPIDEDQQAITDLIEEKSTEKEFDFYTVLPDIEQIMPDDLPDAEPARPSNDADYFLQAASFRSYADAEKLRARLALKGFKSTTQRRDTEDNGTFYRVRLGPYTDKRKAKTAKNQLQKLGVRPFVFTVKKNT